jgi:hypothetical protein
MCYRRKGNDVKEEYREEEKGELHKRERNRGNVEIVKRGIL